MTLNYKRPATRVMVLAVIVVCGAIAIAQTQKQSDSVAKPATKALPVDAAPIPLTDATGEADPLVNQDKPETTPGGMVDPEVMPTAGTVVEDANFRQVGASPAYQDEPPRFDQGYTQDYAQGYAEPGDGYPNEVDPNYVDQDYANSLPLPAQSGELNEQDPAIDYEADQDLAPPTHRPASGRRNPIRGGAEDYAEREQLSGPSPDDDSLAYEDPLEAVAPALVDPPALPADDAGEQPLIEPDEASETDTGTPAQAEVAAELPQLPADEQAYLPEASESSAFESSATELPADDPAGLPTGSPSAGEPVAALPGTVADPASELVEPHEPAALDTTAVESASSDSLGGGFSAASEREIAPESHDPYPPTGGLQGTGKPGPQSLEGPQSPALIVEKRAPAEVQVGRPVPFEIHVRNVGPITADQVVIRDEIPEGMTYIDSRPKATETGDGTLLWELGALNSGDELTVVVEMMPVAEGQIGSVATVSFQTMASLRTRATKPELVLEHSCPRTVLVGEKVRFKIKLSNPGTGAAGQVVLQEDVPSGLKHSAGPKLEYEVGTILPGQSRHLELTLTADRPGPVRNVIVARGEGGLMTRHEVELEVVAPELQVDVSGPERRYLERQATFAVSVANPGTAAARNVELVAQLPRGLKFISTNNAGHYDQVRHAVVWNLEKLPPREMGKAQFTAIPIAMGAQKIQAQARADMGLSASQEHDVQVEGIAALYFGVVDQEDPIEIGGQTSYEVRVVNQGSKAANNVRFVAFLPEGMQAIRGEGPVAGRVSQDGRQVTFDPLPTLAPKAEATLRILVRGTSGGDKRFRMQMSSDEISQPVTKEESTRVYGD